MLYNQLHSVFNYTHFIVRSAMCFYMEYITISITRMNNLVFVNLELSLGKLCVSKMFIEICETP